MRDDMLLREAVSNPPPWSRAEKITVAVSVALVILCGLGLWKLAELIV